MVFRAYLLVCTTVSVSFLAGQLMSDNISKYSFLSFSVFLSVSTEERKKRHLNTKDVLHAFFLILIPSLSPFICPLDPFFMLLKISLLGCSSEYVKKGTISLCRYGAVAVTTLHGMDSPLDRETDKKKVSMAKLKEGKKEWIKCLELPYDERQEVDVEMFMPTTLAAAISADGAGAESQRMQDFRRSTYTHHYLNSIPEAPLTISTYAKT